MIVAGGRPATLGALTRAMSGLFKSSGVRMYCWKNHCISGLLSGLALAYEAAVFVGDRGWFGLNVVRGWLLVVVVVALEETEPLVSNDVPGDLVGDFDCPGRLFCSLFIPPSLLAPDMAPGDPTTGLLLLS